MTEAKATQTYTFEGPDMEGSTQRARTSLHLVLTLKQMVLDWERRCPTTICLSEVCSATTAVGLQFLNVIFPLTAPPASATTSESMTATAVMRHGTCRHGYLLALKDRRRDFMYLQHEVVWIIFRGVEQMACRKSAKRGRGRGLSVGSHAQPSQVIP